MTLSALTVSVALLLSGAKPDTYSERWLCDLWAGAQCHATSCLKDAKERCAAASRKCSGSTSETVAPSRADKTSACAKALLKDKCGAPSPAECADVNQP